MPIIFTRTRQQIATKVLTHIQQATSVVSADMDLVYEALDLRLKEIHALGIFWRNVTPRDVSFTIPANVISASAASVGDMLYPIALHVVDSSLDEPIMMIGVREYQAIPDKVQAGTPEKAFWTGTQSAEFLFWPRPSAATTVKLVYHQIIDDTSSGSAVDVDVSMIRSVCDLVKYDVGEIFDVGEQTMQRWGREAEKAERRIRYLSAERKDYGIVKVEDWTWTAPQRETDYGR